MMNIHWFKNPDHIVYVDASKDLPMLAKQLKIPNLPGEVMAFKENPGKEGKNVFGLKRSCVKMFIPDLTFDEHLDMGENVWLYLGEMYDCYALYWPWKSEDSSTKTE